MTTNQGVRAACEQCHGAGEYFTHSEDCADDLCALNGDYHSCEGQVLPCDCTDDTCPACSGDGYRMGFDDERGCSRIETCRHCRGSGHAPTLPTLEEQSG